MRILSYIKKRLIYPGDKYPKINSFISPDYPLVFPQFRTRMIFKIPELSGTNYEFL